MAANMVPIRRTRTRRLRWLAVFGSALIALTMVAGPASATIIERERFTQDYEFDAWDCGYEMHVVGTESHLFQVRADKKLDGNAFFTDNYQYRETWTAADGRSFTLSANGVFKDVKAKSVGGSLYEFTFHEAVSRSSSRTRQEPSCLATAGTSPVPSRSISIDGSENFELQVKGPHPMLDADLCKAVEPLTGRGLGAVSDATADRLDRVPDGLLRIPAAELQRDRRAEPAAPVLPRLWRDRRRDRGRPLEPPLRGHSPVHQRRRLVDGPTLRRPLSSARRRGAGLRLLVL